MADENIVIQVTDRVPTTPVQKFRDMATSARDAQSAINALNTALNSVNAGANLNSQLGGVNSSVSSLIQSVGNLTTAITTLNQQLSTLNTNAGSVTNNISNVTNNINNFYGGTNRLNASLINLAAGLQVFHEATAALDKLAGIVTTVTEWQAASDRFRIGMNLISQSAQAAAANTQFIQGLVAKLGLEMDATNLSFIRFAAATKDTNLQGQQTQQIFTSIAEAASVLHLTAQQTNNVFLALEQMASKGTVSMEELRRQLGNYIPGAMKLAADAMGVTEAQLQQMIKAGNLAADDFLPKFAEAIHKNYGDAVVESSDSAQAALNRFSNAWTSLERTIADSGVGKAAAGQLNIVTDAVNGISEAVARAKANGSGFFGQAAAAAGGVLSFLNPTNAFGYQAQSVTGLQTQIKQWQDELKNTTDFYKANQLKYNISNNQRLLEAAMLGQKPADQSSTDLSAAQQAANLLKQQTAAVQGYVSGDGKGVKFLTAAETLKKNQEELHNEFLNATKGLSTDSALYVQAYQTYQERLQALNDKAAKPALRAAHKEQQNELSAQITEWQGYADARKAILDTDLASLTTQRNTGLVTEKQYITQAGQLHENELTDLQAISDKQAELAAGKDQLSARQRFLNESAKLEQQILTNRERTAAALTALDYRTKQTATSQLLSFNQSGDNRNRSNANSLLGIGLSSQQQQELAQYQQIQQRADQARLALTQEATKLGTLDSPAYVQGLQKITVAEQTQLQQEKQYFAERDRLQSDWQNGAVASLHTFEDEAKNVAQQTQNIFTETFNGITDALATFVTTGKLSFGSLVNSIITDVVKLELRAAESKLFSTLFSSLGIAGSAGGSAALAGFDSGGFTGNGGVHQIAGVVHGKEFVFDAESTAKLGAHNLMSLMKSAKGYADGGYVGTMPIQSGSNSSGQGQTNLNVNIINNASDQVAITTKQTTDSAGNPTLEVMANLIEGQLAGKIAQGRGKLHDSISSKFGVRSRPGQ